MSSGDTFRLELCWDIVWIDAYGAAAAWTSLSQGTSKVEGGSIQNPPATILCFHHPSLLPKVASFLSTELNFQPVFIVAQSLDSEFAWQNVTSKVTNLVGMVV